MLRKKNILLFWVLQLNSWPFLNVSCFDTLIKLFINSMLFPIVSTHQGHNFQNCHKQVYKIDLWNARLYVNNFFISFTIKTQFIAQKQRKKNIYKFLFLLKNTDHSRNLLVVFLCLYFPTTDVHLRYILRKVKIKWKFTNSFECNKHKWVSSEWNNFFFCSFLLGLEKNE